ncbi:ABC transporter permease subunit [Streptomyces sp. A7024]|uniref:ABC transporter permease subunit n=1 Tax=Streptomyces coryli TaxID=1128680 RepID=A0A6G4U6Z7_9ACTN|nr:ABC transporter permease subunit [Streptomyces coryli]NGN67954.1 ABC transporter permease subunit [Streptomyces coryli]
MSAVTSLRKAAAPPEPDAKPGLLSTRRGRKGLAIVVLAAVFIPLAIALGGSGSWPNDLTVDVRTPLDDSYQWVADNRDSNPVFTYFLLHLANNSTSAVDGVLSFLELLGWPGSIALFTAIAYFAAGSARKGAKVAGIALFAFGVCGLLDMWEPAMETMALMTVAVAVSAVVGLLLGLASGLSDRWETILRPVFDTMQIMPAYAYLLPCVLIFDIGSPAVLLATVIYAAPPMARLTALGLRAADPAAMEASASLGASRMQRLRTARLPLARKEMMLGLNQTIMMALSMVVIGSVVGAAGLGDEVFKGLARVDVGQAAVPGICIVLIAIWLDRTTAAAGERLDEATGGGGPSWLPPAVIAAVTVAGAVLAGALGKKEWPEGWTVDLTGPIRDAVEWFTDNLGAGVPVLGGTQTWSEGFTDWVLNPLRDGLQSSPWWLLVLLAAALGLLVGTWHSALVAALAMSGIGVLGLWSKTLDTLSQVLGGIALTLVLGFAIGILVARSERVERLVRPVLDALQTLPQFIYLIPVAALFGAVRTAAIFAAVAYALPAVIRITAQGIKQVDPAAVEASRSLGASTFQQLRQVQLPLARPALLLAVNQGIVLVLAVVVIGGLIGGGALGYDVVYGLQKSEFGIGLGAGVAIVLLGLVLDRVTQPTVLKQRKNS